MNFEIFIESHHNSYDYVIKRRIDASKRYGISSIFEANFF